MYEISSLVCMTRKSKAHVSVILIGPFYSRPSAFNPDRLRNDAWRTIDFVVKADILFYDCTCDL